MVLGLEPGKNTTVVLGGRHCLSVSPEVTAGGNGFCGTKGDEVIKEEGSCHGAAMCSTRLFKSVAMQVSVRRLHIVSERKWRLREVG